MSSPNASFQLLTFKMNNGESINTFGLNLFKIQEILTYKKHTSIIMMPTEIIGVIQSRDEVIPVIDLGYYFYKKITPLNSDTLIIICHTSNKKMGLIVHHLSSIIDTSSEQMKAVEEYSNNEQDSNLISGLVNSNDTLVSVLNIDELVLKFLNNSSDSKPTDHITSHDMTKKSILVIDDSKFVQQLICTSLKNEGISTTTCLNGQEAINTLKSNNTSKQFDAILCDIEMPIMNGYEFLEEVKTLSLPKKTPIIMYSSLCDDVSVSKAKKLGAIDYITKFNTKKLILSLENHIYS